MLVIRFLLLIAELQEKQKYLIPPFSTYPPEALGGMVNRVAFWWLNPLLTRGARGLLNPANLFSLDRNLKADELQERFSAKWHSALKRSTQHRHVLAVVVLSCVRRTLLWAAIPRICLIGFKIAQPLLLYRVIDYLSSTDTTSEAIGNSLIGATVLVYLGIAVTTMLYKHGINRAITMTRSILVVALYKKTLSLDTTISKDAAAITLMSTDTESICNNLLRLDAMFASPIEVGLALLFLEREVKLACLASVGCALVAVALSYVIASYSPLRQREWNQVVQERVATTASILRTIQGVKLLGISSFVRRRICDLRDVELERSLGARMLIMWRNVIGTHSREIAGPVLTFAIFTLGGSGTVESAQSFTILALIGLITQPIQVFVHGITQLGVALGCFGRIQDYLSLPGVHNGQNNSNSTEDIVVVTEKGTPNDSIVALQALPVKSVRYLSMHNASLKYPGATTPVLTGVTIEIYPCTLTIVTGSVSSGKSSFLKGLIGTLPCVAGSCNIFVTIAYCAQDPWLPDIPIRALVTGFSSFDKNWYDTVLHACALDEDIATFPGGDSTQVGSGGAALSGGQKQRLALARSVYSRRKLLILDETLSALDIVTAKKVFNRMLGPQGLCRSLNMAVILACSDPRSYPTSSASVITLADGTVTSRDPCDLSSEDVSVTPHGIGITTTDNTHPVAAQTQDELVKARDDLSRRDGDLSTYKYYFNSIGWRSSAVFLILIVIQTFGYKFPTLWLMYWSDDEFHYPLSVYLGVYGSFLFVSLVPKSARRLHAQLLMSTLRAPYLFFTKHDSGTLLNKFSQDLSQIDNQLSGALLMTTFGAGAAIAEVMLIASGNKYIAITIPFMILMIYGLQKFYLRTSRQLRFMQLEAQSPLYTHFLETALGTDTIRIFGWESPWVAQCHILVDAALQPYYALFCIQRWLDLVLDLAAVAMAVIVISIAVTLHSSVNHGAIAVSLLNILSFSSSLSFLITSWTQLETSLGAVARIKGHEATTPKEDDPNKTIREPPEEWPAHGSIRFDHAYTGYESIEHTEKSTLRDVTAVINAGEKVAICGRSGSGKSSLLLLIFRMLETSAGGVFIDGINLGEVPCGIIRDRLTIIPQDPVMLPGSLRFNLDPKGQASDAAILSSLNTVGLRDDLQMENHYPLDVLVSEGNLTRGQWQLVSLARALLRKAHTKILVLDEISGSVDVKTERLMFQVIQDHFKDATVVAVTHRLRCIQDFDKILIMKGGEIVEEGPPSYLLSIPSLFKELWDEQ
ncbi:P-loop containing nucleoside triphosphate hydrolase protein [Penicillium coprophilum]|uniref:P-loop containing nucleoside triphosphate hydrolase protein n=1 Tax=Penicillium coprophilum TaxID=36646 RepID=UPI0023A4C85C|nr:P-loop containing nucleoside triphosphate hydrolase protein [Penicillium coprophilum]KAJ5164333.1 P-loop containing nucleoside triphosphate hydrolase protein [Penicillium coprophilum]